MLSVSEVLTQWHDVSGASFYLKSLSRLGRMHLVELGSMTNSKRLVFSKQLVEDTISEVLIGWRDVQNDDGEEIKFSIENAFRYCPQKCYQL